MAEETKEEPLVLNRFKLGAPIGNGAFGQVFVAYDTKKRTGKWPLNSKRLLVNTL